MKLVKLITCAAMALSFVACTNNAGDNGRVSQEKTEKTTNEKFKELVKSHAEARKNISKLIEKNGEPSAEWSAEDLNKYSNAINEVEKTENALRNEPHYKISEDNSVAIVAIRLKMDSIENKKNKETIESSEINKLSAELATIRIMDNAYTTRIKRMDELLTTLKIGMFDVKETPKNKKAVRKAMSKKDVDSATYSNHLTSTQISNLADMEMAKQKLLQARKANLQQQKPLLEDIKALAGEGAVANFDKQIADINSAIKNMDSQTDASGKNVTVLFQAKETADELADGAPITTNAVAKPNLSLQKQMKTPVGIFVQQVRAETGAGDFLVDFDSNEVSTKLLSYEDLTKQ